MPDAADIQILQVLHRQIRQDSLIDMVFAECRLVLFEAEAPQPTRDIHGGVLMPASEQSSSRRNNLSRPTSNRASLACGEMTDMPENRKLAANCGRSRSACAKTAQCRARLDRALVGSKLDTQVRLRNAAGFRGLGLSSKARKRGERLWASKHGRSACG